MKSKQTKQAFGLSLFFTVLVNVLSILFVNNTDGATVSIGNEGAKRTFALLLVGISLSLVCLTAIFAYTLGKYAIHSGNIFVYAGTFVLLYGFVRFVTVLSKGWKNL